MPTSYIKYANLIFAEHKKLLVDNELLTQQVSNLTHVTQHLEHVDSLRTLQIKEYENLSNTCSEQVINLNKEIRKKNNYLRGWQIGGVAVTLGFILYVLLK